MNTRTALIQREIQALQDLWDVLSDELDRRTLSPELLSRATQLCKESVIDIELLIAKLESTRRCLLLHASICEEPRSQAPSRRGDD